MVDCGFTLTEVERRLDRLERYPADIDAILVTHEHADHINGVSVLSRRYQIPVWLTHGTKQNARGRGFAKTQVISAHEAFSIGDLHIQPYPVPHDAREPCQYRFSCQDLHLGLLTDAGSITPHMVEVLSGCHALLLECNYEPDNLANGPYPLALKQRIDSRLGHLSNLQAQFLLEQIDTARLSRVIGMHLSEQNNLPELALAALRRGINGSQIDVSVACQADGFGWERVE
jgi:phosphoribosyl 1,2-cyclic phosphodiesterase